MTMNRKMSAASVLLLAAASGCDAALTQSKIVALHRDEPPPPGDAGRDAGHVVPPPTCVGTCCPTSAECYPAPSTPPHSGPECLAQRENTDQKHWQFRQTLSVSTKPPGIAASLIADQLAQRSELKSSTCNAANGSSGFIQLIDIDREHDTSRVGFAGYAADERTALAHGLCFVEDTYDDGVNWHIPPIPPSAGWPVGLAPPLSLPFSVKPVTAVRYVNADGHFADFELKRDREAILKRLDPVSGDLKDYGGIYFLNEKTGYMHGYAPLVFILNYDSKTQYDAIPIRESELKMQLNDPRYPNCAGIYVGDNPNTDCSGNATTRAWGCAPGSCDALAAGPTTVEGYFLVSELEQIHNGFVDLSLCHLFAGGGNYPGWKLTDSCRSDTAHWDPAHPLTGIPPGDWCAATNDVATDQCHDAWKSVSSATFQAFPIQAGTCAAK